MNTRQIALEWWNGLTHEVKFTIMVKHKEHITGYPDRQIDSFTGREIELLYILNQQ